jgi:phosphoribosylglycinamide formyltransferase-1
LELSLVPLPPTLPLMAISNFKKKIAVFLSGRGSNLKNLYKFSKTKSSKFTIHLVISNKKDTKGILFSKSKKIKSHSIDKKMSEFEQKSLSLISRENIDVICLAGFMRILSKTFVQKCKIPIINIHPSLLPKYKGLNTHARAIENKDVYAGCTVHHVTSKLDSGTIILQKKVKILKKDTATALSKKVLKVEHQIYPIALNKIC